MIPNSSNMATVEGSLDAQEDIKMTIDAAATAHIMSVLTNLYSDQELACLREYSTNALDSHIEAGQTRPIEVTLPSPLSSYLKIKDFGVGMNIDDLRDTYSKYGASTKRESDDYNGTLGLGSKSALTYTHQFTVISVKDGVKYHIAVSRVEDGSAVMQVVDTVSTTEPNGVEISIPVKRDNRFANKAHKFFRFWKPGTVLVNGEDPSIPLSKVSDRVFTFDGDNSDNYIVMANVPYPVNKPLDGGIHSWNRRFGMVAFVETGAIHFTPSREELMYTPATNAVIESICSEYKDEIVKTIRDDIAGATKAGEAYKRYTKWYEMVGDGFLKGRVDTWNGQKIPRGHIVDPNGGSASGYLNYIQGMTWTPGAYRYSVDSRVTFTYDLLMTNLVITSFPSKDTVSYTNKQKIKQYLSMNNLSYRKVVLTREDSVPGAPWTEEAVSVKWEVIAAIRLNPAQRNSGGGKSYAGGYDIWDTDGLKVRHDLKPTDNVVYYSNSDYKADRYGTNQINMTSYQCLTSLMPDVRLVQVSKNRLAKLLRLFPKAKELRVAIQDAVTPVVNALSWEDRVRLTSYRYGTSRWSKHYNLAGRIDDPDISKWMTAFSKPQSDQEKKFLNLADVSHQVTGLRLTVTQVDDPFDKYPLVNVDQLTHSIIYINAAYAAQKGN